MNDTRSSEIDVTNSEERFSGEGGNESVGTPDGADDDGVDESGKEKRVAEVGGHLASFSDGSGDNGGGGGSEGELEEESNVVRSRAEVGKGESGASNEGSFTSIRETESKSVETDGSSTSIQQVLEHDVLDVLLTNRTGTEHSKTGLHQKDGSTGEKEEEGVNTGGNGVGDAEDGAGGSCIRLTEGFKIKISHDDVNLNNHFDRTTKNQLVSNGSRTVKSRVKYRHSSIANHQEHVHSQR